jgi:hypothetical protein
MNAVRERMLSNRLAGKTTHDSELDGIAAIRTVYSENGLKLPEPRDIRHKPVGLSADAGYEAPITTAPLTEMALEATASYRNGAPHMTRGRRIGHSETLQSTSTHYRTVTDAETGQRTEISETVAEEWVHTYSVFVRGSRMSSNARYHWTEGSRFPVTPWEKNLIDPERRKRILENLEVFFSPSFNRSKHDTTYTHRGTVLYRPEYRTNKPGFKPSVETEDSAAYREFRAMIERQQSMAERERLEAEQKRMAEHEAMRLDTLYPNPNPEVYVNWPEPVAEPKPGFKTLQSSFTRTERASFDPAFIASLNRMNPHAAGSLNRNFGFARLNLGSITPRKADARWFRETPVPLNNEPARVKGFAPKPSRVVRTIKQLVMARRAAAGVSATA